MAILYELLTGQPEQPTSGRLEELPQPPRIGQPA
jgi:hypothetical protein